MTNFQSFQPLKLFPRRQSAKKSANLSRRLPSLAGFQARRDGDIARSADLEIGDSESGATCATGAACSTENLEEATGDRAAKKSEKKRAKPQKCGIVPKSGHVL
jgi:hypothetical protein